MAEASPTPLSPGQMLLQRMKRAARDLLAEPPAPEEVAAPEGTTPSKDTKSKRRGKGENTDSPTPKKHAKTSGAEASSVEPELGAPTAPTTPTSAPSAAPPPSDASATPSGRKFDPTSWAKFCRSLEPSAGSRRVRGETCPEELALRMVSANDKQSWYQQWLDAGQSWGKVVLLEEHNKGTNEVDGKKWCDLAKSQIEELLFIQICRHRRSAGRAETKKGMWKPHPELPDMKAAILDTCLVETLKLKETFKGNARA